MAANDDLNKEKDVSPLFAAPKKHLRRNQLPSRAVSAETNRTPDVPTQYHCFVLRFS